MKLSWSLSPVFSLNEFPIAFGFWRKLKASFSELKTFRRKVRQQFKWKQPILFSVLPHPCPPVSNSRLLLPICYSSLAEANAEFPKRYPSRQRGLLCPQERSWVNKPSLDPVRVGLSPGPAPGLALPGLWGHRLFPERVEPIPGQTVSELDPLISSGGLRVVAPRRARVSLQTRGLSMVRKQKGEGPPRGRGRFCRPGGSPRVLGFSPVPRLTSPPWVSEAPPPQG